MATSMYSDDHSNFVNKSFHFQLQAADKSTIQYPSKRGTKNGLFWTQVGLNITVSRSLFHYGQIQVKCVGIIEDGILQGYSVGDGSSHQILEILLPEKLKRERPPAEFVGEFMSKIVGGLLPSKSLM